jgi:hypothetical protein
VKHPDLIQASKGFVAAIISIKSFTSFLDASFFTNLDASKLPRMMQASYDLMQGFPCTCHKI